MIRRKQVTLHFKRCATSGCACAHPREPRMDTVTFGHFRQPWYILYYYSSNKKTGKKPGMRRTYFRDFLSGQPPVTSLRSKGPTRADIARLRLRMRRTYFRDFWSGTLPMTSLPVTSLPVAPPQMQTELCPYTTIVISELLTCFKSNHTLFQS